MVKNITMIVAMPIWEWRVSPVFDTARQVLIVDIDRGEIVSQFVLPLRDKFIPRRAIFLRKRQVEALICGGISVYLARLVTSQGIKVVPGIEGNADEVIKAFCQGNIPSSRFLMAGWRGWNRKKYAGSGFKPC